MSLVHEEVTINLQPEQLSAPDVDPQFVGRRVILAALVLCVLVALARLAFIDGWHRRISIDGPSMAPHWKNEHLSVRCQDCKHVWASDASAGIPPAGFWCPNCGILQPQPEYATNPADRVLVDCWPLLWSEPLRWEVVALMAPTAGQPQMQASVKRVIGLPGEAVTIDNGDIWVDGKRPARRLAQWRQTTVVVHDDTCRVKNKAGQVETRWQADRAASGWQVVENGYRFESLDSATAPADSPAVERLVYHHERLHRGTHIDRTAPLDDDPYNQSPRELNPVSDLALSVWAHVATGANLELSFHDGQAWCTAAWNAENHEWTLFYGDEVLTTRPYSWHMRIPVHTEWLRLDGQLQLVINGRLVARHSIDGIEPSDSEEAPDPSEGNIAYISAAGGVVELDDLRILRDIYYLSPLPASAPSADRTWFLGADEYLVLGDNPPVSVDSRHWPGGSVLRDQIWGVIRRPE